MMEKIAIITQKIMEPKVGIKLKQKARKAQTMGKSSRARVQEMRIKRPVKREITNFIEI